ncbi:THUMP-like domain-containing protein [Brevibacterium album]|uniref:THUMP-like domain-containing protein n=1 Tax=Brevibacterium album TaxID=417948 RepID=UPI0004055A02|nr:SAM-dependent methyltransferase [Brevibacterium album]
MDEATLAQLLDPDALTLLDGIEYSPAAELALAGRLRRDGVSPELARELLAQAQLRQEAEAKFGPFADRMLFTRDGLAQATRLSVAAHHARRLLAAEPALIGDLGCGLGGDTMALGGLGGTVLAVDADPVTAALAAYNLRSLDTVTVEQGTAEAQDLSRFDVLWLDPARRTGDGRTSAARRLTDPESFSPSLTWAFSTAEAVDGVGVKLGPALDHELVPAGWEAQWVSESGDVVEVALFHGSVRRRPGRNALVLGRGSALEVHESQVPADDEDGIGELGDYLFEPDGAIVRAGLVTALCEPLGMRRVSERIAYLTGDALPTGTAANAVRAYEIVDVLPAGIKQLRRALVQRGIGKVVIKKRGADIVPDQVRRQLKLPGGESATLVFTRLGEDHVVLLTQPVSLE